MDYKRYSQHFAALAASLLAIAAGTAVSWTIPVLPKLINNDSPLGRPLGAVEVSIMTSMLMFGNIFGNMFVGTVLNLFGRRRTLLLCGIPIFFFWIALYFIKSIEFLYAARFVLGFIGAFPVAACIVYITEIVQSQHRGKLSLLVMFMFEFGQLYVTAIGSYVSYENLSLICSIVPVAFVLMFFWFPESPYHYLRKGDTKSAGKSLQRLRHDSITEELIAINKTVTEDMERKSGIRDVIFSKEYRRELLIVLGLKTLHQMSGTTAIQSYMGFIFKLASSGLDSQTSSIICTAITIPSMFVSFYAVDKFGRKPLYFVSTIGCASALLLEFTYFLLQDTLKMKMDNFAWLPLSGIILFYIFRSFGVTTLAHLLMGELFPTNVKGAAVSVSLLYGSTLSFLVSLLFPILAAWWGLSYTFLLFSICCLIGFVFILFCVPETKGKTLAEIQAQIRRESTQM